MEYRFVTLIVEIDMQRPYQTEAIRLATDALRDHKSVVLQMPTGSGKTMVAVEMIAAEPGYVWFICHRREIERQIGYALAGSGIEFGLVSPRGKADRSKRVQVISVGTLVGLLDQLPEPSLVIWDECHHVAAKSWAAIREALTGANHLGLTATPERLDGKGLSNWFDELIVGPSIADLISDGWLSPFRYFAPSVPDLTAARMAAGDYLKSDLDKVMNTPVLIGDAVREYRAKLDGKRALIFAASVDASKALVERFNAEGIPAVHVDGKTASDDRDAAVAALASGEINVLSNVEVFTEGFDLPAIDGVILMRPTKSLALYLQMIGRGLRLAEGKDEALILDHAGLWLDHGVPGSVIDWSLDGGARQRRLASGGGSARRCPECNEVRAERAEKCACGFVFPTGREIGEFDGVLREVGVVPDGAITRAAFARRMGVARGTVDLWVSRGMPLKGGVVHEADALLWLIDYRPNNIPPLDVKDPWNYLNQTQFAKKVGVSQASVSLWVKNGLKTATNGWLKLEEYEKWRDSGRLLFHTRTSHTHNLVSQTEFANSKCVSVGAVVYWIKAGMPKSTDGLIDPIQANDWLLRNPPRYSAPTDVEFHNDYSRPSFFSQLIGCCMATVARYKERGLPCASNGWVHTQRGLEWVRDNTSIDIPPEAWPRANDNENMEDAA